MRKCPIINTNTSSLDKNVMYETKQDEFMMAIAAENYDTGAAINDPRYVKWIAYFKITINGETKKSLYPMHQCTDVEFSRFMPPKDETTANKVERLSSGGYFFCIDWRVIGFNLSGFED